MMAVVEEEMLLLLVMIMTMMMMMIMMMTMISEAIPVLFSAAFWNLSRSAAVEVSDPIKEKKNPPGSLGKRTF